VVTPGPQVLADGAGGIVGTRHHGGASALETRSGRRSGDVGRVCREYGRVTWSASAVRVRAVPPENLAPREAPVIPTRTRHVPAFTRPGEAGVFAHFRALAEVGPLPLLVYHVPYRTGSRFRWSCVSLRRFPG